MNSGTGKEWDLSTLEEQEREASYPTNSESEGRACLAACTPAPSHLLIHVGRNSIHPGGNGSTGSISSARGTTIPTGQDCSHPWVSLGASEIPEPCCDPGKDGIHFPPPADPAGASQISNPGEDGCTELPAPLKTPWNGEIPVLCCCSSLPVANKALSQPHFSFLLSPTFLLALCLPSLCLILFFP